MRVGILRKPKILKESEKFNENNKGGKRWVQKVELSSTDGFFLGKEIESKGLLHQEDNLLL